jgi:hypothetical protein
MALIACGVVVLALLAGASGQARTLAITRVNHLTFSQAVGLPGVVLARGTYTFERVDGAGDIVRVWSRDMSRVYYTGHTRRVVRAPGADRDQFVTFAETVRGVPAQIGAWYPQDSTFGHEFIYPGR